MKKNRMNHRPEATDKEIMLCRECGKQCATKASFAGHIGAKHKMKMDEYLIKHYFGGTRPPCKECGEDTRYVRGDYSFRRYCEKHVAQSKSEFARLYGFGSDTGPSASWRKGLTKENSPSVAAHAKRMTGAGNPWYGRSLHEATLRGLEEWRNSNKGLTSERFAEGSDELVTRYEILNKYEDYENQHVLMDARCVECGTIEKRSWFMLHNHAVCRTCTPASLEEREVRSFTETLFEKVEHNTRSVIGPRELDIYVPESRLAIEYNGLYWHTEDRKGKGYHKEKTEACSASDIRLFHIFSDEWAEKRPIVESMIRQRANKVDNRLFARKCEVAIVPRVQSRDFFASNHISGNTKSKITFGLYHEGTLVTALSLRTPAHKKYRDAAAIEIARLATKTDTIVVGGFTRLLSRALVWAKEQSYQNILTYADLRFGTGAVYEKSGFTHKGTTQLDYWYTDGKVRHNRFNYRAQKGKTEKQVAEEAGVRKVYGCGSNIFMMEID